MPVTGYVTAGEQSIFSSFDVYVDTTEPVITIKNVWGEEIPESSVDYDSINGRSRIFIEFSDFGSGLREITVDCPGDDPMVERFKGDTKAFSTYCDTDISLGSSQDIKVTATDWVGNQESYSQGIHSRVCISRAHHDVDNVDCTGDVEESRMWFSGVVGMIPNWETYGSKVALWCHKVAARGKTNWCDCEDMIMRVRYGDGKLVTTSVHGSRDRLNFKEYLHDHSSKKDLKGGTKDDTHAWSHDGDPSDWATFPDSGLFENPKNIRQLTTYCGDVYDFLGCGSIDEAQMACWLAEPWGDRYGTLNEIVESVGTSRDKLLDACADTERDAGCLSIRHTDSRICGDSGDPSDSSDGMKNPLTFGGCSL